MVRLYDNKLAVHGYFVPRGDAESPGDEHENERLRRRRERRRARRKKAHVAKARSKGQPR